jgi:hypothetical protein
MAALEGLIAGAFARELAARRTDFNARFAAARLFSPSLDAAEFAAHLRLGLAPVVDAVAAARPDSASAVAGELYDASLELVAKGLLGPAARRPGANEAWRRLLSCAPRLTSADPRAYSAAVVNAYLRLGDAPGGRPAEWTQRLAALAPRLPDLAALRAAGAVVAWTCGLAALRDAALAAVAALPEEFAREALELKDASCTSREAAARLAADPWLAPRDLRTPAPERRLRIVAEVGGFRGFGGAFRVPPVVFADGGALFAGDDESVWHVRADAFGAALLAAGPAREAPPAPPAAFTLSADGTAAKAGAAARFPELAGATGAVSDGVTLAATVPHSHRVFLLAVASEARA